MGAVRIHSLYAAGSSSPQTISAPATNGCAERYNWLREWCFSATFSSEDDKDEWTDHGDNRAVGEAVVSTVNEDGSWDIPEPDHAELVQMRIRLITLENIVLGLLSGASDEQIEQIRKRADMIEPRPEASRHPLTELAAGDMRKFLRRAARMAESEGRENHD